MKPIISTLGIERFRALRQLRIEGLGRVNLITGRNNSGKSSVLEALRILASDASPSMISRILRYREEDFSESEDATRSLEVEGFTMISSLFSGFPSLDKISESIVLYTKNGSNRSQRLSLSIARYTVQREPDGTRRLVPQQPGLFPETESEPAFIVESDAGRKVIPLYTIGRRGRLLRGEWPEERSLPCVYLSPYGSEHTNDFGPLWDKIVLSDREKDVVEALRIITPDIIAVSMIGSEGQRQLRTVIARSSNIQRPVPLRSFGDGLNRLFGIAISLVNAKDGLLLIDEVENGIHHSVQLDVWRTVFRLSRILDIQVFATSHSWDSVESFQKAAAEDPEMGVLIRLSRKGEDIIPTLFREDELAVVTRDHIEVR
jgi:hypothetical protein